ncbi:MAG TPA: MopE-related protein [Candidatus Dormibacteraeota bacterium]|nr:MopE-related protein [Candidatus Dormibacteraeota bacterium]
MRWTRVAALTACTLVTLQGLVETRPRDLTFEDRVRAQEAIERVYYSHQIGTTRPFDKAITREVLTRMVRTYLKGSVALEKFWHTPVTAEMLRAEWERMLRGTQMPDRLHELVMALGNDRALVEECLARPALVDRLARNFFAYDGDIHRGARAEADRLRDDLTTGRIDPASAHPRREIFELDAKEEAKWAERFPIRPGEVGDVVEERDAFRIGLVLERTSGRLRVASYVVRKPTWEEWWGRVAAHLDAGAVKSVTSGDAIGASALGLAASDSLDSSCLPGDRWDNGSLGDVPDPRSEATAVWTGSFVLVWGGLLPNGQVGYTYPQGVHRYDPATDTWKAMSATNDPSGRAGHTAVWTGSQMLVWGGQVLNNGRFTDLQTGGRYDPVADVWSPMSIIGAPQARSGHTAVWTGSEMVVWGGWPSLDTGGRYDPITNTWTPTSRPPMLQGRVLHSAVWTGTEMIVYGGRNGTVDLSDGGRYDPKSDSWRLIAGFFGRSYHTAVWTGSRMIVWGGIYYNNYLNNGALYDPVHDAWTQTTTTVGAPDPRIQHSAVWAGDRMIIWGGLAQTSPTSFQYVNTGGAYDPSTDRWSSVSTTGAPSARTGHVAVWTGNLMVVWGGDLAQSLYPNRGGRYDPLTDHWTPVSQSYPDARGGHTAVWTGRHMIVWGGFQEGPFGSVTTVTGSRYDPVTDTWSPTSLTNAPSPRTYNTAVWTGSRMVVWGGWSGSYISSGGRYDPIADTWTPTSLLQAPTIASAGGAVATAVWTGARMIVWGNSPAGGYPPAGAGGLYDPAADTWSPISTVGAPSGVGHTAVWTGSRMLVWNRRGGSYDPSTDTWTPISPVNAPMVGEGFATVWTGHEMVVWGGADLYYERYNTGGRYDPETDTWRPTSTLGAPAGRAYPTSVWTGSEMIVWGGWDCPYDMGCQLFGTGGRYDPVTDAWSPTSLVGSPSRRADHTAVWTGNRMIVFGGDTITGGPLATGGRYDPGTPADADGDGYSVCAGDCDDANPAVHPGAAETCNGRDDNCDGHIDEGFDVGQACTAEVDACHQIVGTKVCRADGTGTECSGDTVLHDTTPPQISIRITPAVLWPPNHRLVPVQVQWTVLDACDPAPRVTLSSVTSSEPDDAPGGADGNTTGDIQGAAIGTADASVFLRAERSDDGPGRVYTLTYTAEDASGNRSTAVGFVRVPVGSTQRQTPAQ